MTYALAVAYRAMKQSVVPGLPTLAGFSAIAAVWLGFFDFVRTRPYLRITVVLAILATILLNTAALVSSALHGRGVPVEQSLFTIIFAYVLLGKVRELQAQRPTSPEREP